MWEVLRIHQEFEPNRVWLKPLAHLLKAAGLSAAMVRHRAIRELETAGLIEVQRQPGRPSLIRRIGIGSAQEGD